MNKTTRIAVFAGSALLAALHSSDTWAQRPGGGGAGTLGRLPRSRRRHKRQP